MRLIQLTLAGSGANRITGNAALYASTLVIQNNAGHTCRVGDNTTSSTKGIELAASSASNSILPLFFPPNHGTHLQDWYVAGTAADVIDILYEEAN
jgi:hypothetical protein